MCFSCRFGLLFSFFIFCFEALFAQSPSILWESRFGGSDKDYGTHIEQTKDSGFIVIGDTHSIDGEISGNHGLEDIWVMKLSKTKSIEWKKCFGGTGHEQGFWIQQTFDGGYVFCGWTISHDGDITSYHGNEDIWVVKLNDTGAIEWQNTYGGSSLEYGYCIRQTPDSSYIVAGVAMSADGDVVGIHAYSDAWILRLNKTGGVIWKKCYGGFANEGAKIIQQTEDGNFVFAGTTNSSDNDVTFNHGGIDYWVVKLDDTGKILWQKTYGSSGDDHLTSFSLIKEGGAIASGFTSVNDGDVSGIYGADDFWVVKLDDTGGIVWQKCMGGTSSDQATAVRQTTDSGFVITGNVYSIDDQVTVNYGNIDIWVAKIDKNGTLIWQKNLGGTGIDYAADVLQTGDQNYMVYGWTGSSDHDVVSSGFGMADIWAVTLAPPPLRTFVNEAEKIEVYPIPASETINVSVPLSAGATKIQLFDPFGRMITTSTVVAKVSSFALGDYSNGVYVLRVVSDNGVVSIKIPLQH